MRAFVELVTSFSIELISSISSNFIVERVNVIFIRFSVGRESNSGNSEFCSILSRTRIEISFKFEC